MGRSKKSELEGLHFDILNDYIEKGKVNDLEPEMVEYLKQLEFIQQRLNRVNSPMNVINSLMAFFPELDAVTAKSRFDDALMFFHLDSDSRKQAWRNVLFEISMKAIELAVRTVKTPEAAIKIVDAVEKAAKIKGLHLPDKESIPEGVLTEKVEIHSLTPEDVGLESANRRRLAAIIDQLPVHEDLKIKFKMEGNLLPKERLIFDEQAED